MRSSILRFTPQVATVTNAGQARGRELASGHSDQCGAGQRPGTPHVATVTSARAGQRLGTRQWPQ